MTCFNENKIVPLFDVITVSELQQTVTATKAVCEHPPRSSHSYLQYELLKLWLFLLNPFQPPLPLHLQLRQWLRIWKEIRCLEQNDGRCSSSTSRFWHSCAELVGRPIHLISFFSLEMMFMAMSTLSASYTRRRMFFWSYTCWSGHKKKSNYLKFAKRKHNQHEALCAIFAHFCWVSKGFSSFWENAVYQHDSMTHSVIGWHVVIWRAEFCDQFVCHFIVCGYSFFLHLLTDFHGEMPQAFPILFPFLTTFPENKHIATIPYFFHIQHNKCTQEMLKMQLKLQRDPQWFCRLKGKTNPDDQGEASDGWLCVRNCELGVWGLFTKMAFDTVGLWGVPITCKGKRERENMTEFLESQKNDLTLIQVWKEALPVKTFFILYQPTHWLPNALSIQVIVSNKRFSLVQTHQHLLMGWGFPHFSLLKICLVCWASCCIPQFSLTKRDWRHAHQWSWLSMNPKSLYCGTECTVHSGHPVSY